MDDPAQSKAILLRFFRSLPLFQGVCAASLEELACASVLKKAPKGSFLFFQTDPANGVYLVRRGAVAIQMENPEGRELVINEMDAGDCFGELGALTGQLRSTSAEAIVVCELVFIPRQAFMDVVEKEPTLALHLLEITARRLQNSSKREEALAFQNAQQRLAQLLLQLDAAAKQKGYIALSQEELAQRTGLTRQTVATILGDWRRLGWLLTGRGNIMLLNRRELRFLAQDQKTDLNE